MKNLERALLKTLNCFWWAVLLAPIIAYVLSFAVGVFSGTSLETVASMSTVLESFLGSVPSAAWLNDIWSSLFGVDGVLPFFESADLFLPLINYVIFWSVIRLFVTLLIWIPCFANKLIERWF